MAGAQPDPAVPSLGFEEACVTDARGLEDTILREAGAIEAARVAHNSAAPPTMMACANLSPVHGQGGS